MQWVWEGVFRTSRRACLCAHCMCVCVLWGDQDAQSGWGWTTQGGDMEG